MRLVPAFLIVILWAMQPAAAQIAQPQLGYMRDANGSLRPIFGVAAAALGDPALESVVSFACSAKSCLAKTDTALVSFASSSSPDSVAVPAGPAIIAHAKQGDWIYFPAVMQLARWKDGALTAVDFSPDGRVLSLRATTDGLDYAVARQGGVWIEHFAPSEGSVAVIASLAIDSRGEANADVAPAVMLLDGGVLVSSSDQIALQRPDGTQLTFRVTGAKAFHAAGSGYVQISGSSGMWILRTDPGREELSLLPGTRQGATQQGAVQRVPRGDISGAGQ